MHTPLTSSFYRPKSYKRMERFAQGWESNFAIIILSSYSTLLCFTRVVVPENPIHTQINMHVSLSTRADEWGNRAQFILSLPS